MIVWNFLLHIIGADSSSTRWYYFWSAFGSGPLAWCVLPGVYLRHHNCHERWCPWPGHPLPDGSVICRKHRKLRVKLGS